MIAAAVMMAKSRVYGHYYVTTLTLYLDTDDDDAVAAASSRSKQFECE